MAPHVAPQGLGHGNPGRPRRQERLFTKPDDEQRGQGRVAPATRSVARGALPAAERGPTARRTGAVGRAAAGHSAVPETHAGGMGARGVGGGAGGRGRGVTGVPGVHSPCDGRQPSPRVSLPSLPDARLDRGSSLVSRYAVTPPSHTRLGYISVGASGVGGTFAEYVCGSERAAR